VIVAWILGIKMDLNFNLLETGSLALAIITTGFTLQVYFVFLWKLFHLDNSVLIDLFEVTYWYKHL